MVHFGLPLILRYKQHYFYRGPPACKFNYLRLDDVIWVDHNHIQIQKEEETRV